MTVGGVFVCSSNLLTPDNYTMKSQQGKREGEGEKEAIPLTDERSNSFPLSDSRSLQSNDANARGSNVNSNVVVVLI